MKKGITLFEVAILLVVIGIILAVVLKGKTVIEAAQIKADIYKIRKIRTAYATFFTNHNRLPGENPNPDPTKPTYAVPPYATAQAYAELMRENMLKSSDFVIDILPGAYWNIIGCASDSNNSLWQDAQPEISKGICIFPSKTPPEKDTTGHSGVTTGMMKNTRKFICLVETHLDDRNTKRGIGRLLVNFTSDEDITDFTNCNKYESDTIGASKADEKRYLIKVY